MKSARALKAGDERALEKIIGRYSGYTAAIVMNIIGSYMAPSDVEEVCSDVFLALWKNRESLAPENLKGYLASIARSRAKNKLRELRLCEPLDDDVLALPGYGGPEAYLTQAEEAEALNSALNALNERDRDVFVRHYYLYQTTADISRETGINRETVKTILKSGREKLKKRLWKETVSLNIKITDLFEGYTGEAADLRETDAVSPERIRRLTMEKIRLEEKPVKKRMGKILKITFIAAAVVALLMAGALAVGTYITSETQALAVARRELQIWRDMGLITADVTLDGEHMRIYQYDENAAKIGGWPYRILNPFYAIHNYGDKYSTSVYVDTLTGKIINLSIQAWANEDAAPVPGKELVAPETGMVYYYYENFGDIFDPAMTVGEFCLMLADYWGYGGYTIGRTEDDFYEIDSDGPSDGALLTDCYFPYITVYFDGDQQGVPQYIQICDFPKGSWIAVGIRGHALG